MAAQPRQHRRGGRLPIGQAAFGQIERPGKVRAVGHQRGGVFGAQPPDQAVIGDMATGVLQQARSCPCRPLRLWGRWPRLARPSGRCARRRPPDERSSGLTSDCRPRACPPPAARLWRRVCRSPRSRCRRSGQADHQAYTRARAPKPACLSRPSGPGRTPRPTLMEYKEPPSNRREHRDIALRLGGGAVHFSSEMRPGRKSRCR
jgi:hypothetical protein